MHDQHRLSDEPTGYDKVHVMIATYRHGDGAHKDRKAGKRKGLRCRVVEMMCRLKSSGTGLRHL